jgi:Arc/MetJ family transcription regulator
VPTHVAIDERLLDKAVRIGGQQTKRATVTEALQEYIERRQRRGILKLIGTIDFDPAYDYKRARRRN